MDREKLRETAQQLAERGQVDLALVEYGRLIASDPTDTRALLVSGDLQVRTGDFAAAIATYDSVARLYAEQGYASKAVAVYRQVRQLLTQHRVDLLPRYAHVFEHLLMLLQSLAQPNDALALLDEEANRLRSSGAELEAVAVYRRMTVLGTSTPLPHLRLAESLCRTGEVDEALGSFWAAAELLLGAGRRDDALRVIERMLHFKQDPKFARIAAELYLEKGQAAEAMQALSRLQICFQADPSDLKTLSLLANAFLLIDQEDKAIEVQKELARQAHEQGDKELFHATLNELRRRAPSDDQVHALSQMPPPEAEPKAQKRRAPPKRPSTAGVIDAVSSIPPNTTSNRRSSPGRPTRRASRPGALPRVKAPRVPRVLGADAGQTGPTPDSYPAADPLERDVDQAPDRHALVSPEPSSPPDGMDGPSSEIPVSLHSLLPSTSPPGAPSVDLSVEPLDAEEGSGSFDESALIRRAITDATTYRELGLSERAIDVLRNALVVTPYSIPIREQLRDALAEVGDHDGAIEELVLMAEVYITHERVDHAQTVLQNVLELKPDHSKASALLRGLGDPYASNPHSANVASPSAPPSGASRSDALQSDALQSDALQSGALRSGVSAPSAPIPRQAPLRPAPRSAPTSAPALASEPRLSVLPPMPSLPPPSSVAPGSSPSSQVPSMPAISAPAPPLGSSSGYSRPAGAAPGPSLDEVLEQAETLAARGQFEHAENLLREELSRLPGHPLLLEALEEVRDDHSWSSRAPASAPGSSRSFDSMGPVSPRRSQFPASPGSMLAPSSSSGVALQVQLSELEAAVRDSQNPPGLPLPTNLDVDLLFERFKEGVKAQVSENDSATHYDLGLAYKEMHLLDDAIEELKLAARDPARESVCFSTVALIYGEQGMHSKAMEFYHRGLQSPNRLPEQDITLYYELGNVSELCGQLEPALEYFEEVVGRNPSFRDVRDRIAKLKRELRQSAVPSSNDDEVDRAFEELLGD